ncbi:MAG: lytic transglycosylase domain-containing protein [Clostridiales bacterium]|nr:lytic transglycosylase domain-containing protein [Clostridiales bacterium]
MAKKLISVWLSLTIFLLSSVGIIYAGDLDAAVLPEAEPLAAEEIVPETTHGHYFLRNININGQVIQNYNLEEPLFLSDGATYVPLTETMKTLLGLEATMDQESRTLTLTTVEPQRVQIAKKLNSNLEDAPLTVLEDWTVQGHAVLPPEESRILNDVKETPFMGGISLSWLVEHLMKGPTPVYVEKEISLGEFSLLDKDGTLYVPLKVLESLGWSLYYDGYYGICISTDPAVAASTYCSSVVSKYNEGLTAYVRKFNKELTVAQAQELVFIFRHEADVYDEDVLLLMAMAQRESRFYADAVNKSSGATGLMQIMPATAKANGYEPEEMLDAHTNIQFGAMYISNHRDNYDGDLTLALSAYSQGGGAVNRGQYNTRYAIKVTDTMSGIHEFLSSNGYTK